MKTISSNDAERELSGGLQVHRYQRRPENKKNRLMLRLENKKTASLL